MDINIFGIIIIYNGLTLYLMISILKTLKEYGENLNVNLNFIINKLIL